MPVAFEAPDTLRLHWIRSPDKDTEYSDSYQVKSLFELSQVAANGLVQGTHLPDAVF